MRRMFSDNEFDLLDTNGDGLISRDEFVAAFGGRKEDRAHQAGGNAPAECPNGRRDSTVAADLQQHMTERCALHSVQCPNNCGDTTLTEAKLQEHMSQSCPLRPNPQVEAAEGMPDELRDRIRQGLMHKLDKPTLQRTLRDAETAVPRLQSPERDTIQRELHDLKNVMSDMSHGAADKVSERPRGRAGKGKGGGRVGVKSDEAMEVVCLSLPGHEVDGNCLVLLH